MLVVCVTICDCHAAQWATYPQKQPMARRRNKSYLELLTRNQHALEVVVACESYTDFGRTSGLECAVAQIKCACCGGCLQPTRD